MYQPPTQYAGFGTEEDSLGSVKALEPKRPRKDEKKVFRQDMHVLRFACKLVSTEPDDETREFLLSFFCGDDTIQVYETKCDKNSGRLGGKFIQRAKFKNHIHPERYYTERDFKIGETVHLGGWRFQIQSMDEYTEKYMEDNFEVFPESSIAAVIGKIKKGAGAHRSLQDYVIHLIKTLDTNGDGFLSFDEFRAGLEKLEIFLSEHEVHTIVRKFDHNKDGRISMEEFYNTLAAY
jgi:hypothetical protein